MKLILSRKGFDSSSGGCASPIFDDGSMISLPIPDRTSHINYSDLTWRGRNLGDVVERLTRGRYPRHHYAHLDPDLRREALLASPGGGRLWARWAPRRGTCIEMASGRATYFCSSGSSAPSMSA